MSFVASSRNPLRERSLYRTGIRTPAVPESFRETRECHTKFAGTEWADSIGVLGLATLPFGGSGGYAYLPDVLNQTHLYVPAIHILHRREGRVAAVTASDSNPPVN